MGATDNNPTRERRRVTVLFADLSGFTRLSEQDDPEVVANLMDDWFGLARETIEARGGTTEKYIGDCVMALFGVPHTIERAAERAAEASLELRDRARELFRERGLEDRLDIHMGLNSGVVLAGSAPGSSGESEFRAVGDAVNLGSRLQEAAEPGAILVGAETHFLLSRVFELLERPPLHVKGKESSVEVWELGSRKDEDEKFGNTRRFSSPLVGRDTEVQAIQRLARRAFSGSGQVVLLEGDAGMGKSRLVAELRRVEPLKGKMFLEGRSQSERESEPFLPFADLFRNLTKISAEVGSEIALERLRAYLEGLPGFDVEQNLPFLAAIAGLRPDDDRLQALDGESFERLVFHAARAFLRSLTGSGPIVLFFEDAHYADTSSLLLLAALAEVVPELPCLLVVASRPGFERAAVHLSALGRSGGTQDSTQIRLDALPSRSSQELARNLLGDQDLAEVVVTTIADRTDGNPFFMEEVVRWLADRNILSSAAEDLRLEGSIEVAEIPASVQDVIHTRIESLSPDERSILNVASVIGRNAPAEVLARVLGKEKLRTGVQNLVRREFLFERESRASASRKRSLFERQREYVFVHALVHDTIYSSLLVSERRRLHGEVAAVIEDLYSDRIVDFLAMLALHYTRSEQPEKAEDYLFRAGEEASRAAASREALHYFRQAAKLYIEFHGDALDPRKLARLETQIGMAFQNSGRLSEAAPCFDRALSHLGIRLPRATGFLDAILLRSILRCVYFFGFRRGRPNAVAASETERWILDLIHARTRSLLSSSPRGFIETGVFGVAYLVRHDPRSLPRTMAMYSEAATLFAFFGLFRSARRIVAAADWIIDKSNDAHVFALQFMRLSSDFFEGRWQTPLAIDDVLIEKALRRGEFFSVDALLGLDAEKHLFQCRFDIAERRIAKVAALLEEYRYEYSRSNLVYLRTLSALHSRQLESARAHARERWTLAEPMPQLFAASVLAQAEVLDGDLEGAAATLSEIRELRAAAGRVSPMHAAQAALAELYFAIASYEEESEGAAQSKAMADLSEAVRASRGLVGKYARAEPELLRMLAVADLLLGKKGSATTRFKRSLAAARRLGMPAEEARTLGTMARRLPDPDPAWEVAARRTFQDLGFEWDLQRLARAADASRAA